MTNIVPAVLGGVPAAMPSLDENVVDASQVVLLVIDGLGWNQLQDRAAMAPNLTALTGSSITTVAPSTTASALTSIATGVPPGEHGMVGYRIDVAGEALNALRWTTPRGDARDRIPPAELQPVQPFLGHSPPVITRTEFSHSGFTGAHLSGARFVGYRTIASLALEVDRELAAGSPFIYAYYDGLDRIGHEYGHGQHYEAELRWIDRLVGDIVASLPGGAALIVTADHGQISCKPGVFLADEVTSRVDRQSGEARFRWLHCGERSADGVRALAEEHHGDDALIATTQQVLDERWLGPVVSMDARGRLGQVALLARGDAAFLDPHEGGHGLIGRHGSFTADEMLVPLLTTVA